MAAWQAPHGHAAASTGSTRFLAECLRRLPDHARVFLRADEGFWGQDFFAELERREVTYAIGAPQIASVKARIGEIPAGDWWPSSYRTGSEVASFDWQPKTWKRERRFVVRRDPIDVGEQLRLDGSDYHYYVLVTNDHERSADQLEQWHRAKANIENRIKEAKLGLGLDNLPCRGFHANWAYLLCTLLAYNLLCWLKLLALPSGERSSYAKRLRFRFIAVAVAATVGRSGRRLVLRLAGGYPLLHDFVAALQRIRQLARAPGRPDRTPRETEPAPTLDGGATAKTAPPQTRPTRNAPSSRAATTRSPRTHTNTTSAQQKRRPQPLTAGSG